MIQSEFHAKGEKEHIPTEQPEDHLERQKQKNLNNLVERSFLKDSYTSAAFVSKTLSQHHAKSVSCLCLYLKDPDQALLCLQPSLQP